MSKAPLLDQQRNKRTIDIRDPLHGYILINEIEKEVLDSKPVQRLHYIRQLAGAYLVYPGADHSRFGHSLGVMLLAGTQLQILQEKTGVIDPYQIDLIRLAGLLHDIGHGPFSHTFEPLLEKKRHETHEDLTEWLIKKSEISEILDKESISVKDVAALARGKTPKGYPKWMGQIISGPWDVDKMDFLRRDSHYTGVDYGNIDIRRILLETEVGGDTLVLNTTALYALEALMIARYEMFRAVYYHKTVRSAEIMLVKAMELAEDELGLTNFKTSDEFLELTDGYVFAKLQGLKDKKIPALQQAYSIYDQIQGRRMLKLAGEKFLYTPDIFTAGFYTKPSVKENLEAEIADAAKIDRNAVFIDIPTLPSIPYTAGLLDPQTIPIFIRKDSELVKTTAENLSKLIFVLRGFMDVIRCYTWEKYRPQVAKATTKIFDILPENAKTSF